MSPRRQLTLLIVLLLLLGFTRSASAEWEDWWWEMTGPGIITVAHFGCKVDLEQAGAGAGSWFCVEPRAWGFLLPGGTGMRDNADRWLSIDTRYGIANRAPRINGEPAFSRQWLNSLNATVSYETRSWGSGSSGPRTSFGATAGDWMIYHGVGLGWERFFGKALTNEGLDAQDRFLLRFAPFSARYNFSDTVGVAGGLVFKYYPVPPEFVGGLASIPDDVRDILPAANELVLVYNFGLLFRF